MTLLTTPLCDAATNSNPTTMPHHEYNNRVEPTSHLEKSTAPADAIPTDRTARLKYVYLIAIGVWIVWCLLNPTGRGVTYYDTVGKDGWFESGAFGITGSGSSPFHRRSFLWNPPNPSRTLSASYRWPFQPITQDNVIEISVPWTLGRIWLGIIMTGLAVGILRRFLNAREHSFVLGIAWCLSLTGLVFVMIAVLFAALSMGAGMDPLAECVLAALSIVAGVYWGIRQEQNRNQNAKAVKPQPEQALESSK